jgi:cytochrome c oxidase subunit IV
MENATAIWIRAGIVWLLLNAILFSTLAGAYLEIGVWKLPLALTLACLKAGLVIFVFMELKSAGATSRLYVTVALVWLALLLVMTFGDELTRYSVPAGFR